MKFTLVIGLAATALASVVERETNGCVSGFQRCTDNLDGIITCTDQGVFGPDALCGPSQACDNSTYGQPQCVASVETGCVPGFKKCNDDKSGLVTCNALGAAFEPTETCGTHQGCDDQEYGKPRCAASNQTGCPRGAKKCNDNKDGILVCKADGSGFEAGESCAAPSTCDGGSYGNPSGPGGGSWW